MIEQIIAAKPDSIFDVIPEAFITDLDKYDYVYSGNCFEWYYAIGKVLKPESFIEIGVRFGFSFLPTMVGADESLDYALGWDLETYGNNEIATNNIAKYYTGKAKWELKHIDSQSVNELPQRFDLISIDGCHDYHCKVHDLDLAAKFCKWAILDDFDYHNDVRKSTDDWMRRNVKLIEYAAYIPTFRGSMLFKFK
jgi:hypothetical protein